MDEGEDSGESAAEEETRLSELDSGKVLRAANHLLNYPKDNMDNCDRILLWLHLWTLPSQERVIHIPVPHKFRQSSQFKICLFTKVEPDKSIEETKEFYKDFLLRLGITEKIEIVPVEDAATPRTKQELRLLSRRTVFADEKIRPLLQRQFGESFCERFAQFVDLENEYLAAELNWRIQSTWLNIFKDRNCSIFVAHTGMEPGHIVDNVLAVAEALAKELPMKWKDVRSLSLETKYVKALPIYISSMDRLKELGLTAKERKNIKRKMRKERERWDNNAACGDTQGPAESEDAGRGLDAAAPHKKRKEPENAETEIHRSSSAKKSKS